MKRTKVILPLLFTTLLTACGGGNGGGSDSKGGTSDNNEPTTLTILMSNDFLKGSNEAKVIDAVEKKFKEDTGKSIKLNTLVYSKGDFADAASNVLPSDKWDAAVSYLGMAGIDDKLIRQNGAANIADHLYEDYCDNIKSKVTTLSSLTTITDEVYGIPSVGESKINAILVRKDWMKQVGYTDDAAEAEASGGTLKQLKTITQFTDMLRKFKQNIQGCSIPLAGAFWDLEYVVTSSAVEGHPSYCSHSVVYKEDGTTVDKVVPGFALENYDEVLKYAYDWSVEGLWEKFESTTTYNTRESWFYNEQTGVYVGNPTVKQLVKVSRKLKKYNPEAELTVIGPLAAGDIDGNIQKGKDGKDIKGFRKEASAYSGLVLNPKSKNNALVLEYLNWVYASKENYELCKYGIEGEDWIKVGDDEYRYPSETYLSSPSYSGTLCLVENINISNRTYADYSDVEKGWFDVAKNAETYEDCINDFFTLKPSDKAYNDFLDAQNKMVTNVIYKAINGSVNPTISHKSETDGIPYFNSVASDYISWLTNQYIQSR